MEVQLNVHLAGFGGEETGMRSSGLIYPTAGESGFLCDTSTILSGVTTQKILIFLWEWVRAV